MDLHSPKNRILLKNCLVVKRHALKLAEETKSTIDELSYYFNLYQILQSDDVETLMATLKNSALEEKYIAFNQTILSTPAKDIAREYVALTKSLMQENNAYSDKKFEDLQAAFYKGNEDLLDTDKSEHTQIWEEEPSYELSQDYLTEEQQNYLDAMGNLLRQNSPQTMNPNQLKDFASQFSKLSFALGKSKFEQTFAEEGKTILAMQITCHTLDSLKTVYETSFTLLDAQNHETHQSIHELASTSISTLTSYQTLCYSYLEATNLSRSKSNQPRHNCAKNVNFFRMLPKIKRIDAKIFL